MKQIIITAVILFSSIMISGQVPMILDAPSDNTNQLNLRSVGPSPDHEVFGFQVKNDGVLYFRANGTKTVAELDDETGNMGVGTAFNSSTKIYSYYQNAALEDNPRYGVYSYLDIPGDGSRFGVYGNVEAGTGHRYGVFGRANSLGADHWGVYSSGHLGHTGDIVKVSDGRLKKSILNLESGLDQVLKLKPRKYKFRNDIDGLLLPENSEMGFVAQELEKVLPELVHTYSHDLADMPGESSRLIEVKGVNYIGLIPLLTKAIQEQQDQIDLLLKEVKRLKENN